MQEYWSRLWGHTESDTTERLPLLSYLLVWETPWTEKPGGLQSMGWQRVRHAFPGENARSWEALGEARPGQSSLSAGALRYRALSHVRLFTTPWTAAYQAPPSMGFSRQEYWSGVPLTSPLT